MRSYRTHDAAWLKLAVYFDAARLAPHAFLVALWWRLLGKRVRARAQFAPLLAASPRAYRLWLRKEPLPAPGLPEKAPLIIALVTAGPQQEETLRSAMQQGILALSADHDAPAQLVHHIDWSSAPWLMPLAAGDILATGAGDAYRAAAATSARVVYADDDLLDTRERRSTPHFKPAWNAELFSHFDYLTGACIVRVSEAEFATLKDETWPANLVASATTPRRTAGTKDTAPVHLPHILHHRRRRAAPRLLTTFESSKGDDLPKVSVVVPTRNRTDLLRTCLEGLARTDYPDIEIIVVDNGSDDPETLDYLATLDPATHQILRCPGPFNFSKLNNRAAHVARGNLLCLLNNDIEIVSPDWLRIMAAQALRDEVGAVGAKLLYPDGRIQHAGVVLGVGGGAAHAHRLLSPTEEGYFRRHALPQFVSAVTAACLVVRRDRFEAVGGLDETHFAVAFNDVDLCLRLNAKGWQSLYEPRATLIHHESVSRGLDQDPVGRARFASELAALKTIWATDTLVDPFHHPELSRFSERFVVKL